MQGNYNTRQCRRCGADYQAYRSVVFCSRECAFWSQLDQTGGPDACWLWLTNKPSRPYGSFASAIRGKQVQSHRFAYELANGAIPEGLFVLHRCDTPRCCNPKHLFLGTHQDNVDDRQAKGRQAKGDRSGARLYPERLVRGERNHKTKLSADQVREIRRLYAAGLTLVSIAAQFGVNHSTASRVAKRKYGAHIE